MAGTAGAAGVLRPQQVCAHLDIQPYQLKFWEIEFADLGRRVGPKRLYDKEALELAAAIRRLLVDERKNLDEARSILSQDETLRQGGAAPVESQASRGERGRPAQTPPRTGRAEIHALERALAGARAALDEQVRIHEAELERERAVAGELRAQLKAVEAELSEARARLEQTRRSLEAQKARTEAAQRETRAVRGRACDELSALGADLRALGGELGALLAAMSARAPAPPVPGKEVGETREHAPGKGRGRRDRRPAKGAPGP